MIPLQDERPTAEDAIQSLGYGELSNVHVEETDDGVRLRGRVGSYHMKQMAQEAIQQAEPERTIDNQIVVG